MLKVIQPDFTAMHEYSGAPYMPLMDFKIVNRLGIATQLASNISS